MAAGKAPSGRQKTKKASCIANQKRTVRHMCAEHHDPSPAQSRGRRGTKRGSATVTPLHPPHGIHSTDYYDVIHKTTRGPQQQSNNCPQSRPHHHAGKTERSTPPSVLSLPRLRDFRPATADGRAVLFSAVGSFHLSRASTAPPRPHTSFSLVGSSGQ